MATDPEAVTRESRRAELKQQLSDIKLKIGKIGNAPLEIIASEFSFISELSCYLLILQKQMTVKKLTVEQIAVFDYLINQLGIYIEYRTGTFLELVPTEAEQSKIKALLNKLSLDMYAADGEDNQPKPSDTQNIKTKLAENRRVSVDEVLDEFTLLIANNMFDNENIIKDEYREKIKNHYGSPKFIYMFTTLFLTNYMLRALGLHDLIFAYRPSLDKSMLIVKRAMGYDSLATALVYVMRPNKKDAETITQNPPQHNLMGLENKALELDIFLLEKGISLGAAASAIATIVDQLNPIDQIDPIIFNESDEKSVAKSKILLLDFIASLFAMNKYDSAKVFEFTEGYVESVIGNEKASGAKPLSQFMNDLLPFLMKNKIILNREASIKLADYIVFHYNEITHSEALNWFIITSLNELVTHKEIINLAHASLYAKYINENKLILTNELKEVLLNPSFAATTPAEKAKIKKSKEWREYSANVREIAVSDPTILPLSDVTIWAYSPENYPIKTDLLETAMKTAADVINATEPIVASRTTFASRATVIPATRILQMQVAAIGDTVKITPTHSAAGLSDAESMEIVNHGTVLEAKVPGTWLGELKNMDNSHTAMISAFLKSLNALPEGTVVIVGNCSNQPKIAKRLYKLAIKQGLNPIYKVDDGTAAAVKKYEIPTLDILKIPKLRNK